MPVYDFRCTRCLREDHDVYVPSTTHKKFRQCPTCYYTTETFWRGKATNVVSDECDVWVKHGICNENGTPRHYRFKSEMKKEAERRGLVNHVEHKSAPGTDKSKHTQRWI